MVRLRTGLQAFYVRLTEGVLHFDAEPDEDRTSARGPFSNLINTKFEEFCVDISEEVLQRQRSVMPRVCSGTS